MVVGGGRRVRRHDGPVRGQRLRPDRDAARDDATRAQAARARDARAAGAGRQA